MQNKFSRKAQITPMARIAPNESSSGNVLAATPKGFSRRLHRKQAAEYLGVSLSWLDKTRLNGSGPVFITMGGRVLYDSRDLELFIESNRHSSTSEKY